MRGREPESIWPYYTYAHCTLDGRILYIGKGKTGSGRASDLAPSRRTAKHLNYIRKYATPILLIAFRPAASEEQAFRDEIEWIAEAKAEGHDLCNFTSGGEGASGIAKSPEAIEKLRAAAVRQWDRQGRKARQARAEKVVACRACGQAIRSVTGKSICSKRCESAYYRKPYVPSPRKAGASGVRGVYPAPYGRWKCGITTKSGYRHLGTFSSKEDAISAREAAIRELGN